MSFEQWSTLLTQGGLLAGTLAAIYGYLRGVWISGAQHQKEIDAVSQRCDELAKQIQELRAEHAGEVTRILTDRDAQLQYIRDEQERAITRSWEREDRWITMAQRAAGMAERLEGVASKAVDLANLKKQGTP